LTNMKSHPDEFHAVRKTAYQRLQFAERPSKSAVAQLVRNPTFVTFVKQRLSLAIQTREGCRESPAYVCSMRGARFACDFMIRARECTYELKWGKQTFRQAATRLGPGGENSGSGIDLGVKPCAGVGDKSQRW